MGQTFDVDEVLGSAIDSARPLASWVRDAWAPLMEHRESLRQTMRDTGVLRQLPGESSYLSVGAVDGAYTVTPLLLGDQINALAVSIHSDFRTNALTIWDSQARSDFVAHSAGTEAYAKALMLSLEVSLLEAGAEVDAVTLIDGSHATGVTAAMEALAAEGTPAGEYICSDVISDQVISAVERMARDESIVACPKADSSSAVCEWLARSGVSMPVRFPDKVVSSVLLDEGEVLALPDSSAPWEQFDLMSHHVRSDRAKAIRDRLVAACRPLKDGLRVAHVKPRGSSAAIRVESKASLNDFDSMDYWQAVADDCAAPHTQEPVAQYLADHLAKSVSEVGKVQLGSARLDLAESGDSDLLSLLTHMYRTT